MEIIHNNKPTDTIHEDIDNFLNGLEITYNDNHYLYSLEKKYNKIITTEIEPKVDAILIQYYLYTLGGDSTSAGLVEEINEHLEKLNNNIVKLTAIKKTLCNDKTFTTRIKKIYKTIDANKKKSEKLQESFNETYNKNLQQSLTETYSIKYELNQLHKFQRTTYQNIKNNTTSKNHMSLLNKYLEKYNTIFDELEQEDEDSNYIYKKLVDRQTDVLEYQLDLLQPLKSY
jgi:hypothetical protein